MKKSFINATYPVYAFVINSYGSVCRRGRIYIR